MRTHALPLQVCYPKHPKKQLYDGLVTQLTSLSLPFLSVDDLPTSSLASSFDVVLDAMFGFSFTGVPRPPFDKLLALVAEHSEGCLVAAVDIPSGWDVEQGPVGEGAIQPGMLISLTTPKKGCRGFKVRAPDRLLMNTALLQRMLLVWLPCTGVMLQRAITNAAIDASEAPYHLARRASITLAAASCRQQSATSLA
jgi:hydroxyethylthiazole kinase-like uncharacterized protein yjeF